MRLDASASQEIKFHLMAFSFESIFRTIRQSIKSFLYFASLKVDQTTTKIAYMTAAMTSLANIHGITFSFVKSIGGKNELFQMFPTIKEQVSIKFSFSLILI